MNRVIKSVICVLVIAGICVTYNYNEGAGKEEQLTIMEENVYEDVLRFHVLANSDSDEDQAVKLKVKDVVALELAKDMSDAGVSTKEQAYKYVNDNMDCYIDEAVRVLREEGYDYEVKAELGKCWFPIKIYGNCVYPEGEYDAFRLLIGKAEGKNWWCVLFPSLCMIDEAYMVPSAQTPTENMQITESQGEQNNEVKENNDVKIKFRIVEWFKEMW